MPGGPRHPDYPDRPPHPLELPEVHMQSPVYSRGRSKNFTFETEKSTQFNDFKETREKNYSQLFEYVHQKCSNDYKAVALREVEHTCSHAHREMVDLFEVQTSKFICQGMSACFDPGGTLTCPTIMEVESLQPRDLSNIDHIDTVTYEEVDRNAKLNLEIRISLTDSQKEETESCCQRKIVESSDDIFTESGDECDTVVFYSGMESSGVKCSSVSYTEEAVIDLNEKVEQPWELDRLGLEESIVKFEKPVEENPARNWTNVDGKIPLQLTPEKPNPWDTGWKNLCPPDGQRVANLENRLDYKWTHDYCLSEFAYDLWSSEVHSEIGPDLKFCMGFTPTSGRKKLHRDADWSCPTPPDHDPGQTSRRESEAKTLENKTEFNKIVGRKFVKRKSHLA
jgi:hypothetical protein